MPTDLKYFESCARLDCLSSVKLVLRNNMAPHVYILLLLILNGYYESADAVSTYF